MRKPINPPSLEELKDQIGKDLCEYCPFHNGEIPRGLNALCEGAYCEDAYAEFLDAEDDWDEL